MELILGPANGKDNRWWRRGPKQDISNLIEATKFFMNQATQPIKDVVAAPVLAVVGVLLIPVSGIISLIKGDTSQKAQERFEGGIQGIYDDIRFIASPFEKARLKTINTLQRQFLQVKDSEDSDDEWIADRPANKPSSGKGLRHQYL